MDATLLPVLSRWTDADAGVDPIAGHLPPGMACVDGLAASPDEARARRAAGCARIAFCSEPNRIVLPNFAQ